MASTPALAERSRRRALRRWYILGFGVVSATLVLAGFTRTFFLPLATHTFAAPWFVHVHGGLFFTWIALVISQATLVATRRVVLHRRLGQVGLVLWPLMVGSGLTVACWSTARDFRAGAGEPVITAFFGELMDMAMFGTFAATALIFRRQPQLHKRLVVIATLAVLGAAIGRIPFVGTAANYITLALLLTLFLYDVGTTGRLQRVTLVGGLAFLLGTWTQEMIGSTHLWLHVGTTIINGVPVSTPLN